MPPRPAAYRSGGRKRLAASYVGPSFAASSRSPQTSRPVVSTRWTRCVYVRPASGGRQPASMRAGLVACEAETVTSARAEIAVSSAILMGRHARNGRYRFPIGRLPVTVRARARVLDPRTSRGRRRRTPGASGRAEAARGARDPPAEREPGRLRRAAGRRPLRGRSSGHRRDAGAASGLRPAQGPRSRGDRDAVAGLRAPRRARAARPGPVRAVRTRPRRRSTGPSPTQPSPCSRTLSLSGGAPRSPTSRTSRSPRRRLDGSRS